LENAAYGNSADKQDKYLIFRKLLIISSIRYSLKKSRVCVCVSCTNGLTFGHVMIR